MVQVVRQAVQEVVEHQVHLVHQEQVEAQEHQDQVEAQVHQDQVVQVEHLEVQGLLVHLEHLLTQADQPVF